MKKRNNGKRNVQFFAAAALAAALAAGQIQPMAVMGAGDTIQVSSLIPDNVTVEQPVPLSEIRLPSSDYGTLSWADSSSVPSERVQTYDVIFKPNSTVDLSMISGWDGSSDVIYGSVTVVVSGLEEETEDTEDQEEWSEEENDEVTEGQESNTESESLDQDTEGENTEGEDNTGNEQSESDVIPEATVTPEAEETPEATVTPEAEATPEATVTPEAEETPEATVTPEAEETPEATVTPEAETTPEATVTPEAETTPEATVTPEAEATPEATVTPEAEETPEPTVTPEAEVTPEADKDNIFDREEEEDTRPDQAEEELTPQEQEEAAMANHSCNGISVSGINLPWYVQFRATSGADYQFTNEDEANVFKSYEFELWDMKNNTEYEIPDGEYISVTVPVKAGYTYTIEHLLDTGAMETIVPSVEGSTMVFSTHSFSPFGIAGSKPLVGEELQEDGYNGKPSSPSKAPTAPSATTAPSSDNTDNFDTDTSAGQQDTSSGTNTENETQQNNDKNQGDSVGAVNTGDNTPIGAFVVLAVVAITIIGVILYLRKRK